MKTENLVVLIENHVIGGANKYAEDFINCISDSFQNIEVWGNKEAIATFNKDRLIKKASYNEILIFNTSELIKNKPKLQRVFLRMLLFPVSLFLNLLSLNKLGLKLRAKKSTRVLICNGGYPASLYSIFSLIFIPKNTYPSMTVVSTPARMQKSITAWFWKKIDEMVQRNLKTLIVNSQAIKDEFVNKYHFNPKKIEIIRNCIPDTAIPHASDQGFLTIGFISRLEVTKGMKELVEAYSNIDQSKQKLRLLVAGDGAYAKEFEKIAASNKSIKYLGHYSGPINKLLSQMDIFVLPSYQEGLPYSLIEASMAKCAIIASRVGGIPEIIENDVTGLLIPPRDALALQKALEEIIINEEKRHHLAEAARKFYENNFTLEKMRQDATRIYV